VGNALREASAAVKGADRLRADQIMQRAFTDSPGQTGDWADKSAG
jgi:hypothetical protein